MPTHSEIVIQLSAIGLLAFACQWLAWAVKLPAIIFLLITGIVAGPVTGWLQPGLLFGELLFPVVSMLVAVILFEGSLTLRFEEIRGLQTVVQRMVSGGVLITWSVISLATWWLVGVEWPVALLFGSLTVVTGPTVIVPMLRTVRPNATIASILRWEGIVIDPVGALLAVLVFEFIVSGQGGEALSHTLWMFAKVMGVGTLIGLCSGQLLGLLLRHHLLPEYLHNLAALASLIGAFTLANTLADEAGLLAVTLMGLRLANMQGVDVHEILDFKESLSLLFISGLFILLGARLQMEPMAGLFWPATALLLTIMLVARPLKVAYATWGSTLTWQERAMLAWIAPRGIVAAAISALFALRLEQAGVAGADLLVPLTFMVIIGTVVLQSASARLLAVRLGVAEPEPRGFLIIGANPVARALACELVKLDYRVLLADGSWENIQAARMAGLPTYYGQPVSEHADRYLDLVGIGRLLALAPVSEQNSLAAARYRPEFGAARIYRIQTSTELGGSARRRDAPHRRGYQLFGEEVTWAKLSGLLNQGAQMHSTPLSESFGMEEYRAQYGERALPLFALDPQGRLQIFVVNGRMRPGAGWTLVALITPEPKAETVSKPDSEG